MESKRKTRVIFFGIIFFTFILMGSGTPARADRLDDVIARGKVILGVAPSSPGFSSVDNQGQRIGFDIDLCHAISAAVLGDPNKVQLTPVTGKEGFPSLVSGSLDALVHRFTWTLSRDAGEIAGPAWCRRPGSVPA